MAPKMTIEWFQQFIRFALVGGFATVIHAGVSTLLLMSTSWPLLLTNALAFLVAFMFSYFGNRTYTFRLKSGRVGTTISRWFVVSISGLILGSVLIYILISMLSQPVWLAQTVAIIAPPTLSFILSRSWAFKQT